MTIHRFLSSCARMAGLGLVCLLGLNTPAVAVTPDGATPANENVCDVLKNNATPGLYGLCVAYCEAQDLDLVGDAEPPSGKILANYNKKKQPGDPDMPCIQIPCPCWTAEELSVIATSGTASCISTATTQQLRASSPLRFAFIDIGRTPQLCRYTDTVTQTSRPSEIHDPAVGRACYDQIAAACSANGL